MLSFEVKNVNEAVMIYCDEKGLDDLINTLISFRSSEIGHIHIRGPSAGGEMLDDQNPWESEAIGEVIVSKVQFIRREGFQFVQSKWYSGTLY